MKSTDPWGDIDKLMAHAAEPTGPEWFTVEQFRQRYGLGLNGAHNRVRSLARDGVLEVWKGKVAGVNAITCKYRLKP